MSADGIHAQRRNVDILQVDIQNLYVWVQTSNY